MNLYNVPKPAYQAFLLLHGAGTLRLPHNTDRKASHIMMEGDCYDSLGIIPLLSNESKSVNNLTVLLYNHPKGGYPINKCTMTLTMISMISANASYSNGHMYFIDELHSNPKKTWIAQGSPPYPSEEEIQAMIEASVLEPQPLPKPSTITDTTLEFSITLDPYSVIAIVLPV